MGVSNGVGVEMFQVGRYKFQVGVGEKTWKCVLNRGVFSMHARHALHALQNAIQPKKINDNIFEKISEKVSRF